MNSLLENGYISAMDCGSNFSYILQDSSLFLTTEYKVLESQAGKYFVKCMKMLYNGKVQLYYMTRSLKPFSALLAHMDAESFLTIVSNILADVIDVKHNGFLSCQNLDISFERIYIDPTTYKASLVYLPLAKRNFADYSSFENELRTSLVKLISGISNLSCPKTMQFSMDLSNGTLTLEDLYKRLSGGVVPDGPPVDVPAAATTMRLVAMNAPQRVELVVDKDSYVIGKKAEIVDGLVSFNNMISRRHCRIDRSNGKYTITDLTSANGTFVNRMKLAPNQTMPLKHGDIVRLANSDFQVHIK